MGNKRIVYVDDDEALAEIVQETLERAGHEVVTDPDTERVLLGFAKEPDSCDLVILDHLMPQMKGFELAQWLMLSRADLPIILVTGHPDLISPKEAERAGIREVLTKPLTRPELFAAIERALSSPLGIVPAIV
jgi:DNA-binding NtrC family response regulator